MRVDLFDFDLPERLVASRPAAERDGARLLHVREGDLADRRVRDLPELIPPGALVVVNDTRVIPARLFGQKPTGGRVEVLLVERRAGSAEGERWKALGRASKPFRTGDELAIEGGELTVRVEGRGEGGVLEVLVVAKDGDVLGALDRVGHVPLPPYVGRDDDALDRERYQTVFARAPGAIAAPTAGLHLSEPLLASFAARGVERASITLHVGLGTFRPVSADDLDRHDMHEEWLEVPDATARAIEAARARNAPVLAVGTTVVRALETAADRDRPGLVRPFAGTTKLLIQPGYAFRVVDRLLTNFHLPRSTLLALVSAFAGRSRMLAAYAHAVAREYRFYSYGDAMLIDHRASPEEAAR